MWRAALAVAGVSAALAGVTVVLTPEPRSTAHECPPHESEDTFTGVCMPVVPTDEIVETTPHRGGLPQIDGVPCTGHNSYECLGLAEESQAAGPTPTPHASVAHSP